MDKMTQLLKLLEKTDTIEINEFRMDFEELEIQLMPAVQRAVQQVVQKQAAAVIPKKIFQNHLHLQFMIIRGSGRSAVGCRH